MRPYHHTVAYAQYSTHAHAGSFLPPYTTFGSGYTTTRILAVPVVLRAQRLRFWFRLPDRSSATTTATYSHCHNIPWFFPTTHTCNTRLVYATRFAYPHRHGLPRLKPLPAATRATRTWTTTTGYFTAGSTAYTARGSATAWLVPHLHYRCSPDNVVRLYLDLRFVPLTYHTCIGLPTGCLVLPHLPTRSPYCRRLRHAVVTHMITCSTPACRVRFSQPVTTVTGFDAADR